MSRTYRRKKEPVPSWVTRDWVRVSGYYYISVPMTDKKAKKRALAKYHSDAERTMKQVPSWWIRNFHTVQERVITRDLTRKVLKLADYEDSPEFPLDKKPYIYYW